MLRRLVAAAVVTVAAVTTASAAGFDINGDGRHASASSGSASLLPCIDEVPVGVEYDFDADEGWVVGEVVVGGEGSGLADACAGFSVEAAIVWTEPGGGNGRGQGGDGRQSQVTLTDRQLVSSDTVRLVPVEPVRRNRLDHVSVLLDEPVQLTDTRTPTP